MSSAPTPSPQRPSKPGTPPPRPAGNDAAKPPAKPPEASKPAAAPKQVTAREAKSAEAKPAGDTKPTAKPTTSGKPRSVPSLPGSIPTPAKKPKEPPPEKAAAPKKLNLSLPEWQYVARGLMLLSWGWAGMNVAWLLADVQTHFFGGVGWLEPVRQYVLLGGAGIAFLVYLSGQVFAVFTPEESDARLFAFAALGLTASAAVLAVAGWFVWQMAWPGWFVAVAAVVFLAGFLTAMLYMRQLASAINDADLAMQSGLIVGAVGVTAIILGVIAIRGIPTALVAYRGIFILCLAMVVALIVGIQWGVAYAIRWRLVRW